MNKNPEKPSPQVGGVFSLHAGMFLLSLSVLGMEILQTRLYSIMLWHHVTYFVVTITLLGFAASGTAMAIFPGLSRGNVRARASLYSLLFGLTTIMALWVLAWQRPETLGDQSADPGTVNVLDMFLSYFYLTVPYFFAGLAIGSLLKELAGRVGPLYAANLTGSAAGCFLFVLAITPLGGAGATFVTCLIAALGAMTLAKGAGRLAMQRALVGTLVLLAGTIAAFFIPDTILPMPVAGSKLMAKEMELRGVKPERTIWSPTCRIDVVPTVNIKEKRIYQDGDAPSTIWRGDRWPDRPEYMNNHFYGLAYQTKTVDRPKSLIIGPGGGVDVEYALHFKAAAVTAVEINPAMLAMARNDYGEFSAHGRKYGVYERPEVTPVVSEGRAWLRRSRQKFDNIQMTGTDTYAALASGAYVFSESYLYTTQAFQEYLNHLNDHGTVAVLRFRFEPARESLKLAATAVSALQTAKVKRPQDHILVINVTQPLGPEHQKAFGMDRIRYAVIMVRKRPWLPTEIETYRKWLHRVYKYLPDAKKSLGFYAQFGYAPGVGDLKPEGAKEYLNYFAAVSKGKEKKFYRHYPYDIMPVDDDQPFFFKFHKWSSVLGSGPETSPQPETKKEEKLDYESLAGRDPIGLQILLSLLVLTTAAVLLLVLLPLVLLRRTSLGPQKARVFTYFFCIGLGFIFAEVASLQRFVLFLGHPTYSLTVVLFGFLFFMGVGSLASQRLRLKTNRPTRIALSGVLVFLLLHILFLPAIFSACLHFSNLGRMLIATACIAPLACCMGFAFPSGIRITNMLSGRLIPWAWGVNGAASVAGSVVAIILAMAGGFSLVIGIAGACYLTAIVAAPRPPDNG